MKRIFTICICGSLLLLTGCGKVPTLENGEELVGKIKIKILQ